MLTTILIFTIFNTLISLLYLITIVSAVRKAKNENSSVGEENKKWKNEVRDLFNKLMKGTIKK